MDTEELQKYIRQIRPMSDESLSLLVQMAENRKLKKSEHLLEEGNVCDKYYLVEKGYLRTWFYKDGSEINIHFTLEGGFTTIPNSSKARMPSKFTIEAGEASSVWLFDRRVLADLCTMSNDIMLFSRRLLSRMLVEAEEVSNIIKIYTPSERYRYIEKNNPALLQRVTLSQLASYLGVARETLSRIRSKK